MAQPQIIQPRSATYERARPIGPGDVVASRFEVEANVAVGGMGSIYRARDRATGERVAVKLLRGLESRRLARFSREASLLARLAHPGIVRYITHGRTESGAAYLVMEWLDGEDLHSCLQRRRVGGASDAPAPKSATGRAPASAAARPLVTAAEAIALGRRLAAAVAALHQRGSIHRDIKPANIYLPDGSFADARLLDLGIARSLDDAGSLTRTGQIVGTPHYMAPEQARASRNITPATDVWAMGVVLYECLTGSQPFHGPDLLTILTRIAVTHPPPIGKLCPDLPDAIADVIMAALSKDPAARPRDAATFGAAFEQVARDQQDADRSGHARVAHVDDDTEAHGEFLAMQAAARFWSSEVDECQRLARAAMTLLPPGSPLWYETAGHAAASRTHRHSGVDDSSFIDMIVSTPCLAGAEDAQMLCLCRLGISLLNTGQPDQARALCDQISALRRDVSLMEPRTRAQFFSLRGMCCSVIGDMAGARRYAAHAASAFDQAGDAQSALLARNAEIMALMVMGDSERVLAICRENLDRFQDSGVTRGRGVTWMNLGYCLALHGQLDRGRHWLQDSIIEYGANRMPLFQGMGLIRLAQLEHRAGEFDASEQCAARAASILDGNQSIQSWALAVRARALSSLGRLDEALAQARRAMALFEGCEGALLGRLDPFLALAEVLHTTGDHARARHIAARGVAEAEAVARYVTNVAARQRFMAVDAVQSLIALSRGGYRARSSRSRASVAHTAARSPRPSARSAASVAPRQ